MQHVTSRVTADSNQRPAESAAPKPKLLDQVRQAIRARHYALARKYPNADREWGWQWAFPAPTRYFDKEAKTERRHHLHETAVQKAMKLAVNRARIGKPATPHVLRHSFARTC